MRLVVQARSLPPSAMSQSAVGIHRSESPKILRPPTYPANVSGTMP